MDNTALQTEIKNLQGEVKKLKAEVATLKRSGHPGGSSANKKRGEDLKQNGKERYRHTNLPGRSLHNIGSMGREATHEHNEKATIQATRPSQPHQQGREASTLVSHRASNG